VEVEQLELPVHDVDALQRHVAVHEVRGAVYELKGSEEDVEAVADEGGSSGGGEGCEVVGEGNGALGHDYYGAGVGSGGRSVLDVVDLEEAGVAELCGVRDVVQERLHLGLWGRLEERKKVLLRGVEHGFVALTGGVLALSRVKIVTFGFVSVGLGAEEEEAGFAMPS